LSRKVEGGPIFVERRLEVFAFCDGSDQAAGKKSPFRRRQSIQARAEDPASCQPPIHPATADDDETPPRTADRLKWNEI
jgi:hypothetical protein